MLRDILYLTVPDFAIALARAGNPTLRCRPLAVVSGQSQGSLLSCVSPEARREGVTPGMSAYLARKRCPALQLMAPQPGSVAKADRVLQELALHFSPLWEPKGTGRLFLDLTGSRRLLGSPLDIAARLERQIANHLQLPVAFGLAGNKMVARMAVSFLDRPGICQVLRGGERDFIAPLSVDTLPGVGNRRSDCLLRDLNLHRVEQIAALSVAQLEPICGSFAPLLQQRAKGIDLEPVRPPQRSLVISEETLLEKPNNETAVVRAALGHLAEGCGRRLRRLGQVAGRLILCLVYDDGCSVERRLTLNPPCQLDLELMEAADELLQRAWQRRICLRLLRLRCEQLVAPARQLCLFSGPVEELGSPPLQNAFDDLRQRFGSRILNWGRNI